MALSTHPRAANLDHNSYPYIFDQICANASRNALLALRSTSRKVRDRIDARMLRHITITVHAVTTLDGHRPPCVYGYFHPKTTLSSRIFPQSWLKRPVNPDVVDVVHDASTLAEFSDGVTHFAKAVRPRLVRELNASAFAGAMHCDKLVSFTHTHSSQGAAREIKISRPWVLCVTPSLSRTAAYREITPTRFGSKHIDVLLPLAETDLEVVFEILDDWIHCAGAACRITVVGACDTRQFKENLRMVRAAFYDQVAGPDRAFEVALGRMRFLSRDEYRAEIGSREFKLCTLPPVAPVPVKPVAAVRL